MTEEITVIDKPEGVVYTPSSELTALSRRARMVETTDLLSRGHSLQDITIAQKFLDECMAKAVEEYFMNSGSGEGSGLASLLK